MDLGLQQAKGIRWAGMIHDVGKVSVPAEILNKPGRLSEIEFELIQDHAVKGHEILAGVTSAIGSPRRCTSTMSGWTAPGIRAG